MVLFISLYMWFRIAQNRAWTLNAILVAFYNKPRRHEDNLYGIIFGRPNRDPKKKQRVTLLSKQLQKVWRRYLRCFRRYLGKQGSFLSPTG